MNFYGFSAIIRHTLEVLDIACDGWLLDKITTRGLEAMISHYFNGQVYCADLSIDALEVASKFLFNSERGN